MNLTRKCRHMDAEQITQIYVLIIPLQIFVLLHPKMVFVESRLVHGKNNIIN